MYSSAVKDHKGHHPCFFSKDKGIYGRIHLPVAPSCNIQCAYCRRDHECLHESRPGVTKKVLSPEAAVHHLEQSLETMPFISVVGIAGPGDAFRHPELTLRTLELVRRKYRNIALCLSTNGLNIKAYLPQLLELNVGFVTITINAVDPGIGARLYRKIDLNGCVATGTAAAEILINRQIEAVSLLKAHDFTVKVNSVIVPGINEGHILFLAKKMAMLKVDLMNLIPLIPLAGTDLQDVTPPDKARIKKLREMAGEYVPQMHHCTRCRSDAAGLLTPR